MQTIKSKVSFSFFVCAIMLFVFSAHAQGVKEDSLSNQKTKGLDYVASINLASEDLVDDGKVTIKLAGKDYHIAYADSQIERQLGLMYRRKMCDDCGMLFKFESVRIASIWMKNTYIPLDLAYITEQGEIVDIKQLTPHDITSVPSSKPVLYALEMNQGWFAKQDIRVGDKAEKLP